MNPHTPLVLDRINVLGVRAHAVNVPSALRVVQEALQRRRKGYVCFVSVHSVLESLRNPAVLDVLNHAFLAAPDGMPLVWVGRQQRCPNMERVAGPEFMLELMASPEFSGCRHFLCGGEVGMAEELAAKLRASIPGIEICGTFTPPFRALKEHEERALVESVHRAAPDIVWVGLGAPKQELFMARYLPLLDTTLMMGVGAAFLMHTGRIRQSPVWVRRAGLQWMHRLLQEPGRLWRRYLLGNPLFVSRILWQFLRHGRATSFEAHPAATELHDAAKPA